MIGKRVLVFTKTILNIFLNFIPHETIIFLMFLKRKEIIFNETILNIFINFIPHETTNCDDRSPLCINESGKQLITEKKTLYKKF